MVLFFLFLRWHILANLAVKIGSLVLRNPVMPASGCFAIEYQEALNLNNLGALVLKSVSPKIRSGNPTPRVAETHGGMLNSIGIPSKGLDHYIEHILPAYTLFDSPVIASVSADTVEEFALACQRLSLTNISAIEANISCPNLEADGMAFAMSAATTYQVVSAIRRYTDHPLWVKLTPNAANIALIAKAAQEAGADAIVMGNTILGMAIDIHSRTPKLGNVMGGLSGPAIKPIALRLVHQCYRAVRIPIIGCGGISSAADVIEFMLAGASAIQVGTASFLDPCVIQKIIDGVDSYCEQMNINDVRDLIGQVVQDPQLTDRWLRFAQQSG